MKPSTRLDRMNGQIALVLGLASALAMTTSGVGLAATMTPGPFGRPAAFAPIPPAAPTQVVVFDRQSRTTTLVSHDNGASKVIPSSSRPSISADGSLVAFESDGVLAPGDGNGKPDIYLWDRASDTAQRLSIGLGGAQPNGASHAPSISADGGVIAFASTATNLTANPGFDGKTGQVFAWQRSTGAFVLVSVADGGRAGGGSSSRPSASADGRVVGFQSAAANLVSGDSNGVGDVFLRDLTRGATIRASVATNGAQVGAESGRPSVSGDGGAVVFDSNSGALVPQDSNKVRDVFLRDLPPAVAVTPNPVDFGVVPLGTPASQFVTVLSIGWTPVVLQLSTISGTNATDFVVADDACAGLVVAYGASCSIAILDVPAAAGPRTATLSIPDTALDAPQVVRLIGGVPGAEVDLQPEVGPPGIVTIVRGSNFPPGALVAVRWDRGITQPLAPVVVGPDGTFTLGVLVFHHDRIGPRQLLVTAAPGGPTFADETAPFLVVPAPLQPPGSSALTFLNPELRVIVTRR